PASVRYRPLRERGTRRGAARPVTARPLCLRPYHLLRDWLPPGQSARYCLALLGDRRTPRRRHRCRRTPLRQPASRAAPRCRSMTDEPIGDGLDPLIHEIARLRICATLAATTAVEAQTLKEVAGLSDSALSKHRSEEHTSELQSRFDLVCRLL